MESALSLFDSLYVLPALAFVVMLGLVPAAVWLAHHYDFLDHPEGDEGRKQHKQAVPPIGGVLMFPVFLLFLLASGFDAIEHWAVLTALALVVVTGAIDDRFHIHAYIKLVVQVTATVLLIWPGGAMVDDLGNMFGFGDVALGVFAPVFSFAAVLLLINSVNLSDGLDGLAGGQAVVICGWLLFVALGEGRGDISLMILMLMAVLAGFLVYNMRSPLRRQALLFMGDAGSMGLGVMIAFLAVTLGRQSGEPGQILTPMSVAWVIALPVMDACAQFIRRMVQGRHPFDPDRGHLHYLLVDAGLSAGRTVALMLALCFVFGAFGLSTYFWNVPQAVLTLGWAGVFAAYTLISIRPQGFQTLVRRACG